MKVSRRTKRYAYAIKTLADVRESDEVLVPNGNAREVVEIWRWLAGHRKDFPAYEDGAILIKGIDEAAWCAPKVYRAAFCPLESTCIVREAA